MRSRRLALCSFTRACYIKRGATRQSLKIGLSGRKVATGASFILVWGRLMVIARFGGSEVLYGGEVPLDFHNRATKIIAPVDLM